MLNKDIIILTAVVVTAILLIIFLGLIKGSRSQWLYLVYAVVIAVIASFIIEFLYRKFSGKSWISNTTVINKPRKLLAKLILPDKKELIINEYEKIFGREDFIGLAVVDELLFIGKKHFRLTRLDDGFYIEDLDTKNGTMVNGEEISNLGKIKLKNNDKIKIASVLEIRYLEDKL